MRSTAPAVQLLAALLAAAPAWGWLQPPADEDGRPWCERAGDPRWPFAYARGAAWERKGRTASNRQSLGHACALRGARSKCHRCDEAASSAGGGLQLQGVDWGRLPGNVPTASDAPFAVGPGVAHRYHFAAAARACVFTSGGGCTHEGGAAAPGDYARCALRCWGPSATGVPATPPVRTATGWAWSQDAGVVGAAAGRVWTLAGGGSSGPGAPAAAGFGDGNGTAAQFRQPHGVALSSDGSTAYVADSGNHVIRAVRLADGRTSTFAGQPGRPGHVDGDAASTARFSHPAGLALYVDCGLRAPSPPTAPGACSDVLVVADTQNHAIRAVIDGQVSTLAGGGGVNHTQGAAGDNEVPPFGYADGVGAAVRFDSPQGVAADDGGNVFVADTRNHLLRWVDLSGAVRTLVGRTGATPRELPGCPPLCLQGQPGRPPDGANLTHAELHFPYGVAIGPGRPFTLVLLDADRLRLVTRAGQDAWAVVAPRHQASVPIPGVVGGGSASRATHAEILALDSVVTLAGALEEGGEADGLADEARLDKPRGLAVEPREGRVFLTDSSRCRVRMLTPASVAALPDASTACTLRGVDVVAPPGCSSTDPPIDALGRMVSQHRAWLALHALNVSTAEAAAVFMGVGDARRLDGRRVAYCVGPAPPDVGNSSSGVTAGPVSGTRWAPLDVDEDVWQGSRVLVACPPGCGGSGGLALGATAAVFGDSDAYGDESSICAAAVHAGAVADSSGGTVYVVFGKGVGRSAGAASPHGSARVPGVTRNGVASLPLDDAERTFSLSPLPAPTRTFTVQTIAGAPASPLESACGHADGAPAAAARFHGPAGIALNRYAAAAQPRAPFLVVADSHAHAVRAVSPVCTNPCENGGACSGPDECDCAPGWAGADCTRPVCSAACGAREICVGTDTCGCIPGYTGAGCATAQCVQTCANGGVCAAPDTCACGRGWWDPNCTTPVCSQTCGNGGNCTGPDACSCAAWWTGADCRTPVCPQGCAHGGVCTAPNTCTCAPNWSGHDCSVPVCHQGFFQAAATAAAVNGSSSNASSALLHTWDQFLPCDYSDWCAATREFECLQTQRVAGIRAAPAITDPRVSGWGVGRAASLVLQAGADVGWPACVALELDVALRTPYRLQREVGDPTAYSRWSGIAQYGWGGGHAWSAPAATSNDRQVAVASWVTVQQGAYVCANGGACTAPDYCVCAPGWTGFDCRTPVCSQGFYYPRDADATAPGRFADPRFPEQGTYVTSRRTLTLWERPATPGGKFSAYMHEHPNFHSAAADSDPSVGLSDAYERVPGRGNETNEGWRRGGWFTRAATPWGLVDWQPGSPLAMAPRYARVCTGRRARPGAGLPTADDAAPASATATVGDTFAAFAPRLLLNDSAVVSAEGVWDAGGRPGDAPNACVDHVQLGCFNGGTCVAPDTCVCADGWAGDDCSVPLCEQAVAAVSDARPLSQLPLTRVRAPANTSSGAAGGHPPSLHAPPGPGDALVQYYACPHRGNCTHPGVCTCEKGWAGPNCSTPLCAQECLHGGVCSAPDVCTCPQWPSDVRDARGVPVYQKPDGSPQDTGWTGFDCGTPVCVQATAWVANDDTGRRFIALETTANDGKAFQGGCGPPSSAGAGAGARRYAGSTTRVSARYLCGLTHWWMGNYAEPWANADAERDPSQPASLTSGGRVLRVNTPNYMRAAAIAGNSSGAGGGGIGTWVAGPRIAGEGLYACANKGSCVAPDTCVCPDGWAGPDCATPLCRHINPNNSLTLGCANGGICASRDTCVCPQVPSQLWVAYPSSPAAAPVGVLTGFAGEQCTKPMCAQGFFVEACQNGADSRSNPGCWRCPNGGNCTAPDTCACPRAWAGFDCRTPVCTQHASLAIIAQLNTLDARKVAAFEQDPCGAQQLVQLSSGGSGGGRTQQLVPRGNCSRPGTCTCLCRRTVARDGSGRATEGAWRDPFGRPPPAGWVYGDGECLDGYSGLLNADGSYGSCHLRIYVPTWLERNVVYLLCFGAAGLVGALLLYVALRRILRARHRRLKAARRKRRQQLVMHVPQQQQSEDGGSQLRRRRRRASGEGGGRDAADSDGSDGSGGAADDDCAGQRARSRRGGSWVGGIVGARLLRRLAGGAAADGARGAGQLGAFTHRDAAAGATNLRRVNPIVEEADAATGAGAAARATPVRLGP